MSDQFDALFEQLHGQAPPVPFAPAEAVRRRGRQRANRQAVSVGVAVLAVTGLGAGSVVTLTGDPAPPPPPTTAGPPTETPSPTPSPTTAPVLTEIPDRWLLTPDDLGRGPWDPPLGEDDSEWLENGWVWGCNTDSPADDYPSIGHRLDQTTATWHETEREDSLPAVREFIELFEAGWGPANLDDVRAGTERCSQRPTPGMEVAPVYQTVLAEGSAGDESLLIQEETYTFEGETISPDPWYSYVAVVRVGDVVRTIVYAPWTRAEDPEAPGYVQELARRAVERLR